MKSSQLVLLLVAMVPFVLLERMAAAAAPNLPFSDINVVVVTDVHSWVGGHGYHEGDTYNADYGDVISFVERLKAYASANDRDVWFVMNGDWIDGTGLAVNGDPSKLIPILEKMPWDAMNVGNHELYDASVIEVATQIGGFVESFGPKYLSSNVLHTASMQPIGHHYRILHGKNANVLTFGFLYNMQNNADLVTVQSVESAVEQDWFVSAVLNTHTYDAVLVLAHMDVRDPLCQIILDKIRTLVGDDMPVQFLTGHTHRRDHEVFDQNSASFEGGRFLDTVGFVSFPSIQSITTETTQADSAALLNATIPPEPESLFQYKFLDAHVNVLADALGIAPEALPTENGILQSEFILRIQTEMGLREVIGCISQSYFVNRTLEAHDSLWGFFRNRVVATMFSADQVLFLGNGAWRYDLLGGEVRLDDAFAVSPFNSSLVMWENVPAEIITALNETMNAGVSWKPQLPKYILSSAEPFRTKDRRYSLIVDDFEKGEIMEELARLWPNETVLPPPIDSGATTTSIWIDYFKQHPDCRGGGHGHNGGSSAGVSGFVNPNPEADAARLAFAAIAIVVVALLGSLAVWQKGTRFRYISASQEQATREALQEFEGDEGLYLDASDETEGEFV